MTRIGVFAFESDEATDDPTDRTYQELALYDTDRNEWTEDSDGDQTRHVADTDLSELEVGEVVDLFRQRLGGRFRFVGRKESVPGEIEKVEPVFEPGERPLPPELRQSES